MKNFSQFCKIWCFFLSNFIHDQNAKISEKEKWIIQNSICLYLTYNSSNYSNLSSNLVTSSTAHAHNLSKKLINSLIFTKDLYYETFYKHN